MKIIKNHLLIDQLKSLVATERKTTAEMVECIREIDRQRLFLDLGHSSLFSFLTKEIGYTPASAQRRIDAARMSRDIPELKQEIKSGALNLTQVSLLAQSVRQKQKEEPKCRTPTKQKRDLLEQVKNLDLKQTEHLFAKALDIKIKTTETKHQQADESTRMEITFTKDQMEELKRVKEVISHSHSNPNMSELFSILAKEFLKRKDPTREVKTRNKNWVLKTTSVPEVTQGQNLRKSSRFIPNPIRRQVFQRDGCCQWKSPTTDKKCESKFQLQIDHKQPIWADGGNNLENLQLLCSAHNQQKYFREAGIKQRVANQIN